MTVRIYKYTDPGAPILNGSFGTIPSVLDGCLVNGYQYRSALIVSGAKGTITAPGTVASWSFAGWIKPDASAIAATRATFLDDSTNGRSFGLASGKLSVFFGATNHPFNTTLVAGNTYHVAFLCAGGTVTAYVNGVLEATTVTGFGTPWTPTTVFNNNAGTETFTGNISDWMYYATTNGITATDVANMFAAGSNSTAINYPVVLDLFLGNGGSSLYYWRFDEPTGSTLAFDRNSRTKDITISGTVTFQQTGLLANTASKVASGWTKAFTATARGAYQQAVSGILPQLYLDVDHSPTSPSASTGSANVRGYETMSALSTGTNPFPTVAQQANTVVFIPGSNATGGARPWVVVADGRRFFWWSAASSSDTVGSSANGFFFGDIKPLNTADLYRAMIIHPQSSSPTTQGTLHNLSSSLGSSLAAHFLVRSYTQGPGSVTAAKAGNGFIGNGGNSGGSGPMAGQQLPNPEDNAFYISRTFVSESNSSNPVYRGTLPGYWAVNHKFVMPNLTEFAGVGSLAGKTLIALNLNSSAQLWVETSDTWDI